MYGLSLSRWTLAFTVALSTLAQAATYSVSNQSSCESIPGAAWNGTSSVCNLAADLALASGDTLGVVSPAGLGVPEGVTLTNNGGLLHIQLGAKLFVSGGTVRHLAGTIDNDGFWDIRGATSAVVTSAAAITDNSNQIHLLEGRFDNHGTLNQSSTVSFFNVAKPATLRNFFRLVNGPGADVFSRGRIENTAAIVNNGTVENHCGVFVNTGVVTGFPLVSPHCWVGGAAGLWNVASNWSLGVVPPTSGYIAIESGTATLNVNLNFLGTLLLEGGHLVVAPGVTFTNFSFVSLAAGSPGSTTVRNRGTFVNRATLENSNQFINEATFGNFSTIRSGGAVGTLVNSGSWTNHPGGSISAQGIDNGAAGVMANHATMQLTLSQSFNAGKLTNHGGGLVMLDNKLRNRAGGSISNLGTVFVSHRLTLPAGIDNEAGATIQNQAGAVISITAAAAFVNNAGLVRNDGTVVNRGIVNNTGVICGTGAVSGTAVIGNPPAGACVAIAKAGADQSVGEGSFVMLDGSASSSPNNAPLSYTWTQTAGPAVVLDTTDPARPSFTAPPVSAITVLSFRLVVNDGFGSSVADFVDVFVGSTNSPPVADAGNDRTARAGSVVTLDSSHSFDPDGNAIASYEWTQVAGPSVTFVPGPDSPTPSFTAPTVGSTLVFKLRVSDGQESSVPSAGADASQADTVAITVVENSRPVAVAGPDRSVAENSLVLLDGGASFDNDAGDVLAFAWRQVAGPPVVLNHAASATASFMAPSVDAGGATLAFELVVRDNDPVNPLPSAPATVRVTVTNLNDPPRCDLAAPSVGSIWPPDLRMSTVGITGVADDGACGMPLTLRITGVRQDEPVSGLTPSDPSPDAVIVSDATADTVQLRRQRSGQGNGRVYTIAFTAHDGLASCTGTVKVEVPHSRNGVAAADDGPLYDSTGN